MVEKDTVTPGGRKVRHVGIFDFKETYRTAYSWFVDNGYDLIEQNYTEKITAKGKEIEILWVAYKKVSDYFRFNIKTGWRILGMNDVEVEQDGKKIKLDKGDIEIKFNGTLEKDYEGRWEDTAFLKFLRGVYDKYIVRARISDYEGKLFGEVDEVLGQMRAFLALTVK